MEHAEEFVKPRFTQLEPKDGILNPEPNDIICGRGKSIAHSGNQKFRQLVLQRKEEYQAARRREEKTRLTIEIVDKLRSGPESGRFLLKDPKLQLWFEVDEEYMKEKVSHALRSRPNEDRRKRLKPKKKPTKKQQKSPAVDQTVEALIKEQQELLKSVIERERASGIDRQELTSSVK